MHCNWTFWKPSGFQLCGDFCDGVYDECDDVDTLVRTHGQQTKLRHQATCTEKAQVSVADDQALCDAVGPGAASCTEAAAETVALDKTACDKAEDLATPKECMDIITKASNASIAADDGGGWPTEPVRACTYTPAPAKDQAACEAALTVSAADDAAATACRWTPAQTDAEQFCTSAYSSDRRIVHVAMADDKCYSASSMQTGVDFDKADEPDLLPLHGARRPHPCARFAFACAACKAPAAP